MFSRVRGWLFSRKIERQIRKRGWTGFEIVSDGRRATWFYTVGLARHGWPEVVISGAARETSALVMHAIYRQLRSGELVIRDGETWPIPEWITCAWRRIHPAYLPSVVIMAAQDYWTRTGQIEVNPDVFQLVFPDEKLGRLPWEDGFDEDFRRMQDEYWLPPHPP